MARAESLIQQNNLTAMFASAGVNYIIQTPGGVLYCVYIDNDADVNFKKSTDGGLSWGAPVEIFTGTTRQLSIWYDRWSGLSTDLIHCAYSETGGNDVLYRSIDAGSSDALGTQTTIFNGASIVAATGALSITRSRGGNLYCLLDIDGGTEHGFIRSVDTGANWVARTDTAEGAAGDMFILAPGFGADNQDIICIYWDASADEISRKLYDDSANTWAETSISGTMADAAQTTAFPHFAVAPDLTNSLLVLIAWNAVDGALADLKCWTVSEAAITAKTDVVANGTDDQGLAAIGINTGTGTWYAFYAGKSDGSETWNTAVNIYYKTSTDSGATWGSETLASLAAMTLNGLFCIPRFTTDFGFVHLEGAVSTIMNERYSALIPSSASVTGISRARAASGF